MLHGKVRLGQKRDVTLLNLRMSALPESGIFIATSQNVRLGRGNGNCAQTVDETFFNCPIHVTMLLESPSQSHDV